MQKARVLVQQYVKAGFTKIHLDASMPLQGETTLSFATIAERAADLCAVAEKHAPDPTKLFYIVGTEVPIPGGETEELDALDVTTVARFEETIQTHKAAFAALGLGAAWDRVVSVVTQPGVDFSHTSIYPFAPDKARDLAGAVTAHPGLTFEAHSTDYQSTKALNALVEKHFFFLKVGPELTFRFREAVYALAKIEQHLLPDTPSNIEQVIAYAMQTNDGHWRSYYDGTPQQIEQLKVFSYSDRIRYYWPTPAIDAALTQLIANLSTAPIPEVLVSQYFSGLEFGRIPTDPQALIRQHIQGTVQRYFQAAGAA
jgi:D-tagatose-1,6-bisphosphate aldolase subunit GatZ/KbaZ